MHREPYGRLWDANGMVDDQAGADALCGHAICTRRPVSLALYRCPFFNEGTRHVRAGNASATLTLRAARPGQRDDRQLGLERRGQLAAVLPHDSRCPAIQLLSYQLGSACRLTAEFSDRTPAL
jgi:hypothetical protein